MNNQIPQNRQIRSRVFAISIFLLSIASSLFVSCKPQAILVYFLPISFGPWFYHLFRVTVLTFTPLKKTKCFEDFLLCAFNSVAYLFCWIVLVMLTIKTYFNFAILGEPFQPFRQGLLLSLLLQFLAVLVGLSLYFQFVQSATNKKLLFKSAVFAFLGCSFCTFTSFSTSTFFADRAFDSLQLWIWMGSISAGGGLLILSALLLSKSIALRAEP